MPAAKPNVHPFIPQPGRRLIALVLMLAGLLAMLITPGAIAQTPRVDVVQLDGAITTKEEALRLAVELLSAPASG